MFPVLLQLYLAIWCASGKIAAAKQGRHERYLWKWKSRFWRLLSRSDNKPSLLVNCYPPRGPFLRDYRHFFCSYLYKRTSGRTATTPTLKLIFFCLANKNPFRTRVIGKYLNDLLLWLCHRLKGTWWSNITDQKCKSIGPTCWKSCLKGPFYSLDVSFSSVRKTPHTGCSGWWWSEWKVINANATRCS